MWSCLSRGPVRKRVPFDPRSSSPRWVTEKRFSPIGRTRLIFFTGRCRGCGFLHPKRQYQAHLVSEQGKEAVVAILSPGQFFGEGCLNGHPLRIATARAVDECVVTRLEKTTMIATVHNEPEFSELFMPYLVTPQQSD